MRKRGSDMRRREEGVSGGGHTQLRFR